jgi:hypothetical protein
MTARKLYRAPAFLAVVVALVAGLFLLGRVSDNATVSMGLTGLWFGLVFVAAAALALRIRILLWPLAIGYAIVAVAAGVLVIAPTLIDKKVDEQIVTGAPATTPSAPGTADGELQSRRTPRGNVQIAAGRFSTIAHASTGRGGGAPERRPQAHAERLRDRPRPRPAPVRVHGRSRGGRPGPVSRPGCAQGERR